MAEFHIFYAAQRKRLTCDLANMEAVFAYLREKYRNEIQDNHIFYINGVMYTYRESEGTFQAASGLRR